MAQDQPTLFLSGLTIYPSVILFLLRALVTKNIWEVSAVMIQQVIKKQTNSIATCVLVLLALAIPACKRAERDDSGGAVETTQKARPGPGVIDVMTGKAAVDAGQRAKDVIRDSNEKRDRQFEEAMDW